VSARVALVDYVKKTSKNRDLREALESIKRQLEIIEENVEEIAKLAVRFKPLAELYAQFKGCTEEYTYVYNKQRKQYYYWYLKCPGKNPSSIYLGSSREGYNIIKNAARIVAEFVVAVETLIRAHENLADTVTQLERAIEALETLTSKERGKEENST